MTQFNAARAVSGGVMLRIGQRMNSPAHVVLRSVPALAELVGSIAADIDTSGEGRLQNC